MKKLAVYAMLLLGATNGSALGVPAGVVLDVLSTRRDEGESILVAHLQKARTGPS